MAAPWLLHGYPMVAPMFSEATMGQPWGNHEAIIIQP